MGMLIGFTFVAKRCCCVSINNRFDYPFTFHTLHNFHFTVEHEEIIKPSSLIVQPFRDGVYPKMCMIFWRPFAVSIPSCSSQPMDSSRLSRVVRPRCGLRLRCHSSRTFFSGARSNEEPRSPYIQDSCLSYWLPVRKKICFFTGQSIL